MFQQIKFFFKSHNEFITEIQFFMKTSSAASRPVTSPRVVQVLILTIKYSSHSVALSRAGYGKLELMIMITWYGRALKYVA